jgi:hypothetical protein
MKEFYLPNHLPIETRFMVKRNGNWSGYNYQWNSSGTDGTLVGDVGVVAQGHYFPSRAECLQCHSTAANRVLGLQTVQMNRDYVYSNTVDNQLRAFEHAAMFSTALPDLPAHLPALKPTDDAQATVDDRARSYLHANCSFCHMSGGPTPSVMDLRVQTPMGKMQICNVAPSAGDLGVLDARIIKPNHPEDSTLWLRMATRDGNKMPPLASLQVDAVHTELLEDWIAGMNAVCR